MTTDNCTTSVADELPNEQLVLKLKEKINWIDALSQEGFGQIEAIANLAINQIERPSGSRNDTNTLHQALLVIRGKAQEVENCINLEAEAVGCHFRE